MNTFTSYTIGAKTDKGLVRAANEDAFIVNTNLEYPNWSAPESNDVFQSGQKGALFVVADGMGGTRGGAIASNLTVQAIKSYFSGLTTIELSRAFFERHLANALQMAHQSIIERIKEDPSVKDMGTTCTMAWLYQNYTFVSWIGDSRAYLLRKNRGLVPLSKDHSYVQELIDAKRITEKEAFDHPDRNIITQSLGDTQRTPNPSFSSLILEEGDRLLLCSDGLNSMIRDQDIEQILVKYNPAIYVVGDLIEAANKSGGLDNITTILCDITALPHQNDRIHLAELTTITQRENNNLSSTNDEPQKEQTQKKKIQIAYVISIFSLLLAGYFIYSTLTQPPVVTPSNLNGRHGDSTTATTTAATITSTDNPNTSPSPPLPNYPTSSTSGQEVSETNTTTNTPNNSTNEEKSRREHTRTHPVVPKDEKKGDNKGAEVNHPKEVETATNGPNSPKAGELTKAKIRPVSIDPNKYYLFLGSYQTEATCLAAIAKFKQEGKECFMGKCDEIHFYILASQKSFKDAESAKEVASRSKLGVNEKEGIYQPCH